MKDVDLALYFACKKKGDNFERAQNLLEAGANPNAKGESSQSFLNEAILAKSFKVAAVLAKWDATDINFQPNTANKMTALMLAIDSDCPEFAEILLSRRDINVNIQTRNEETALNLASKKEDPTIALALIAREDTDVNIADMLGTTALMNAAKDGRMEIVDALLARKDIKASMINRAGDTAKMVAVENGHMEIAALVEKRILQEKAEQNKPEKKKKALFDLFRLGKGR